MPLKNQGCGSPVVNISDHGDHVMNSSPVPLKTRRVGQRSTLNLSRAETATRWTALADSDVVQSGRSIFDDFFQHLWPYIGNNTANVVFQMVKRLWLIRIDQ
ncbi:hypothetical protein TNCV_4765221 [Trichonephila clavipes]|nr:hypothetical protein TNCV_4765221 [Trichonephila clavipes]